MSQYFNFFLHFFLFFLIFFFIFWIDLFLEQVQKLFISDTLRVFLTEDVIGVEVGGALKNIFAIGGKLPIILLKLSI